MICAQDHKSNLDSIAIHYWDYIDFSDTSLYVKPLAAGSFYGNTFSAMEEMSGEFFSLLLNTSEPVLKSSVKRLLDKACSYKDSRTDPFGFFMAVAEKYFYDIHSPYYNENSFLAFLDYKTGREDIAEIEKSREKYLSALIRKNMVGTMAENLALKGGGKPSLYDVLGSLTERQSLMLVFFSAECGTCIDGITRLKYSPVLKKQIQEGEMAVLAVCVEGKLSHVKSVLPGDWMVASDGGAVYQDQTYSIRNTPSVYVLERSGIVLLKDADVSSAIDILLE